MRKSKNKIEKKSVGRSAGFVVSPTFFAAALFEKFLFFSRSSCELEQQKFASSPSTVGENHQKCLIWIFNDLTYSKSGQLNSCKMRLFKVIFKHCDNSKCPEQKFKGSLLMVQNSLLIIFCNVVAEY